MPAVDFDNNGNPVPYDIIKLSIIEFKDSFVSNFNNSQKRILLFENYKKYIKDFYNDILKGNDLWIHWIDGSYTTNKANPNDIDLVNIVHSDIIKRNNITDKELEKFLTSKNGSCQNDSKSFYSIDAYIVLIYEQPDERNVYYKAIIDYWKKWFGHDRNQNPKGIVEISISNNSIAMARLL